MKLRTTRINFTACVNFPGNRGLVLKSHDILGFAKTHNSTRLSLWAAMLLRPVIGLTPHTALPVVSADVLMVLTCAQFGFAILDSSFLAHPGDEMVR